MRKLLITFLFTFLIFNALAQEEEKDYSEAIAFIEQWLDAKKDYDRLPGISAVALEGQEIIWSGGFGLANKEKNVKTTASTICSICSISKLFTSVAIMKLYDEGKLRLDDEVGDLLPWFNLNQKFEDSSPITVRALMTHSAGLPREANYPYWVGPDFPFPTTAQIKSELKNQETIYPASSYFQYSNLGLTLLGEIVAEVAGVPYDQYVEDNILKPLMLKDTRTELPEDLYGSDLAFGYSQLPRTGERQKVNLFQAEGIKPAAGFSSNVLDLAKFAAWQFRLMDSTVTEILKPSTLKYMQTVQWTDPDWELTWGLGFHVYKGGDGTKWVSHGGYCPGYQSTIQMNPSTKRAYSVMINSNGVNPNKYVRGIHELIKKVKSGPTALKDKEENDIDLHQYAGAYTINLGQLYIGPWEGKLAMLGLSSDAPADNMELFKHVSDDTFQRIRKDGTLGETLKFDRNEKGEIIQFWRHQLNFTKIN